GTAGKGTITWSGPSSGEHRAAVQVFDRERSLRGEREVIVQIYPELTASVPQMTFTTEVNEPLTIVPSVEGLIGEGENAVRWGSSPGALPEWLAFDDKTGHIVVDTTTPNAHAGIRLTAVDQVDFAEASTDPFLVKVNPPQCTWTGSPYALVN